MTLLSGSSEIVWTYARGDELIRFRRANTTDGLLLIESVRGRPDCSYFFMDLAALARYRDERVQCLEHDGWSLVDFSPERRSVIERRQTRLGSDRRQAART